MDTTQMAVKIKGAPTRKEHSFLRKNGITILDIAPRKSGCVETHILGSVKAVELFLSEMRPQESIFFFEYI